MIFDVDWLGLRVMRGLVCHTVTCPVLRSRLCARPHRARSGWQRQSLLSRLNMQTSASIASSNLQHLYEIAMATFSTKEQPKHVSGLEAVSSALREALCPSLLLYPPLHTLNHFCLPVEQIPLQELGLGSRVGLVIKNCPQTLCTSHHQSEAFTILPCRMELSKQSE